jgi:flagellar basal-body rod protein FlgC
MGMFGAIDAAASGLTAERLRMDVISNNIANVNTTRTAAGGAYRRKMVVFEPRSDEYKNSFARFLDDEMNDGAMKAGEGVRAVNIVEDDTPLPTVYDPGHPDANADGYVEMPNLNIVTEMVDMITASRAYEANATAISTAKSMASRAMEIGK